MPLGQRYQGPGRVVGRLAEQTGRALTELIS
ncbi:hypothetical protein ACTIVE_4917 [Actinomadura verrucosospora]|uniref:Uncharacterized protein n=1 Tax=Actinomadura verrucosospora TaxID=46165 RepID=A0A7D3VXF7_ACTVE|nr:hypothetical protein ACTIVE_4917 [Actinomadura verrucosospora]